MIVQVELADYHEGGGVNADLEALLALQKEDVAIVALEERAEALANRERALDQERAALVDAIARAREAIAAERERHTQLDGKVQQHRALQQRNLAALESVWKAKEATAAMVQVEMARKVLLQEESDLQAMTAQIQRLEQAATLHEAELAEAEERQRGAREQIAAERSQLDAELAAVQETRSERAARVSRPILSKYERIRRRDRTGALYALRGAACGRCNTAIPLQRRNLIAAGRSIEVCEACGVLLYATE
ncbi:MAG TPA: hypothetical protein VFK13_14365 [Gemmatimonadaceae bacterium]|nr:hypothetical protein [Gemmatimonadaceae bacterium]